jgi:hypothetical protein
VLTELAAALRGSDAKAATGVLAELRHHLEQRLHEPATQETADA